MPGHLWELDVGADQHRHRGRPDRVMSTSVAGRRAHRHLLRREVQLVLEFTRPSGCASSAVLRVGPVVGDAVVAAAEDREPVGGGQLPAARPRICSTQGREDARGRPPPRRRPAARRRRGRTPSSPVVTSSGSTTSSAPSVGRPRRRRPRRGRRSARRSGSARSSNCTAATRSTAVMDAAARLDESLTSASTSAPLHLAGVGVARQLIDGHDPGRHLVAGELDRRSRAAASARRRRGLRLEHDGGDDLLAVSAVGDAHDGGLPTRRRLADEHRLDLGRRNVGPAADDHVGQPADHLHVARARRAGPDHPCGTSRRRSGRRRGQLGVAPVAHGSAPARGSRLRRRRPRRDLVVRPRPIDPQLGASATTRPAAPGRGCGSLTGS